MANSLISLGMTDVKLEAKYLSEDVLVGISHGWHKALCGKDPAPAVEPAVVILANQIVHTLSKAHAGL